MQILAPVFETFCRFWILQPTNCIILKLACSQNLILRHQRITACENISRRRLKPLVRSSRKVRTHLATSLFLCFSRFFLCCFVSHFLSVFPPIPSQKLRLSGPEFSQPPPNAPRTAHPASENACPISTNFTVEIFLETPFWFASHSSRWCHVVPQCHAVPRTSTRCHESTYHFCPLSPPPQAPPSSPSPPTPSPTGPPLPTGA